MQVTKAYAGTLVGSNVSSSRPTQFGNTKNLAGYWDKIDFINQTIADFLKKECGVEAAYESRHGEANKYLWIYGAPFLFYQYSTSSTSFNFAGPYTSSFSVNVPGVSGYTSLSFYSAAAARDYSFSIVFTGNPKTGFTLRFINYNAKVPNNGYYVSFIKAKNLLNQKDSVVWKAVGLKTCYGIDLNEDGMPDKESMPAAVLNFENRAYTEAANKAVSGGNFPLIPMRFGIWKPEGFYLFPDKFGVPAALGANTEMQTEIEISGRKFINTVPETTSYSYINLGLIEVTG